MAGRGNAVQHLENEEDRRRRHTQAIRTMKSHANKLRDQSGGSVAVLTIREDGHLQKFGTDPDPGGVDNILYRGGFDPTTNHEVRWNRADEINDINEMTELSLKQMEDKLNQGLERMVAEQNNR